MGKRKKTRRQASAQQQGTVKTNKEKSFGEKTFEEKAQTVWEAIKDFAVKTGHFFRDVVWEKGIKAAALAVAGLFKGTEETEKKAAVSEVSPAVFEQVQKRFPGVTSIRELSILAKNSASGADDAYTEVKILSAELATINSKIASLRTPKDADEATAAKLSAERAALRDERDAKARKFTFTESKGRSLEVAADEYAFLYKQFTGKEVDYRTSERFAPVNVNITKEEVEALIQCLAAEERSDAKSHVREAVTVPELKEDKMLEESAEELKDKDWGKVVILAVLAVFIVLAIVGFSRSGKTVATYEEEVTVLSSPKTEQDIAQEIAAIRAADAEEAEKRTAEALAQLKAESEAEIEAVRKSGAEALKTAKEENIALRNELNVANTTIEIIEEEKAQAIAVANAEIEKLKDDAEREISKAKSDAKFAAIKARADALYKVANVEVEAAQAIESAREEAAALMKEAENKVSENAGTMKALEKALVEADKDIAKIQAVAEKEIAAANEDADRAVENMRFETEKAIEKANADADLALKIAQSKYTMEISSLKAELENAKKQGAEAGLGNSDSSAELVVAVEKANNEIARLKAELEAVKKEAKEKVLNSNDSAAELVDAAEKAAAEARAEVAELEKKIAILTSMMNAAEKAEMNAAVDKAAKKNDVTLSVAPFVKPISGGDGLSNIFEFGFSGEFAENWKAGAVFSFLGGDATSPTDIRALGTIERSFSINENGNFNLEFGLGFRNIYTGSSEPVFRFGGKFVLPESETSDFSVGIGAYIEHFGELPKNLIDGSWNVIPVELSVRYKF